MRGSKRDTRHMPWDRTELALTRHTEMTQFKMGIQSAESLPIPPAGRQRLAAERGRVRQVRQRRRNRFKSHAAECGNHTRMTHKITGADH